MQSYTTLLQSQLNDISPDDENFIDELLEVSKLFRTFSEGLDEFIVKHGYEGNLKDTDGKLAFIRNAFKTAQIEVPRELAKWYTELQPIKRETAFQICFAFGLDGPETDEFFRRVFARERSLDCHVIKEAVYYFCLNNDLSYVEAQDILRQLPEPPAGLREGQPVVYTCYPHSETLSVLSAAHILRTDQLGTITICSDGKTLTVSSAESQTSESRYIGNRNSMKFHNPLCESVADMAEHNKVPLLSREDALALGFSACGKCHP